MKYFMHKEMEIPYKLGKKIRTYFNEIKAMETEVVIEGKKYKALVDSNSFLHLANFDCFNCLTNCCVQFPYEFNSKSRKVILENLEEYDELTKALWILREEGESEETIINSIKNDPMLIPEKYVETLFNRCTCSSVYEDRSLCALHKICVDKKMDLKEIIETKPLWCSIYPLEIVAENDNTLLYIFLPTKENSFMSMNDSDFPCMDIEKSKSALFRRENPIGFKETDYKPFIIEYYSILKYILGEKFVTTLADKLLLKIDSEKNFQYSKKTTSRT